MGRLLYAFLQKGRAADEGAALPLSLLMLAVVSTLVAAVWYESSGTLGRVGRLEDLLAAQNIAHAGFETELRTILDGKPVRSMQIECPGGGFSVSVTDEASPDTKGILVSGWTTLGGHSRISAKVDLGSKNVIAWNEQP